MTLVKFNNGHKAQLANPFFNDVYNLLSDSLFTDNHSTFVPAVNVGETENQFEVELAVPGLKKEDFKINLDKNVLTISADKKAEAAVEGKKYSKREYSFNSFTRSFTLPESADHSKIEANYTDGILTLAIAKKEEAKIQSREIAVK